MLQISYLQGNCMGFFFKQIHFLLWLLPINVISRPLLFRKHKSETFPWSSAAMQDTAQERGVFGGLNREIAEGKKNKKGKKKKKEVKKTDTVHANVSWGQSSDSEGSTHSPLTCPRMRRCCCAKAAGPWWAAVPAGDGCAACRLRPQPMSGTQRAAFIKPVWCCQRDGTADSSGLK